MTSNFCLLKDIWINPLVTSPLLAIPTCPYWPSDMDTFTFLVWFIIRNIISYLPGLPSIFQFCETFPKVKVGILEGSIPNMAPVMESRIQQTDGKGMNYKNRTYIHVLALIWWRILVNDTRNPLPGCYEPVIGHLDVINSTPNLSASNSFLNKALPLSIPPTIIYNILEFFFKVHQISHACFHDCMARCMMTLSPTQPKEPKSDLTISAGSLPRERSSFSLILAHRHRWRSNVSYGPSSATFLSGSWKWQSPSELCTSKRKN